MRDLGSVYKVDMFPGRHPISASDYICILIHTYIHMYIHTPHKKEKCKVNQATYILYVHILNSLNLGFSNILDH